MSNNTESNKFYKVPIEIPFNDYTNDLEKAKQFKPPICNLIVSDKDTPFTFRIDAVNCSGYGMSEYNYGYPRTIPKVIEPTTGFGFYLLQSPYITFQFDVKKSVQLKLFGVFPSDGVYVEILSTDNPNIPNLENKVLH